jgi:hypothetical protein
LYSQKIDDTTVLFHEILSDVQAAYVDPVETDKLFETGVRAMLGSLDPCKLEPFSNKKHGSSLIATVFRRRLAFNH